MLCSSSSSMINFTQARFNFGFLISTILECWDFEIGGFFWVCFF